MVRRRLAMANDGVRVGLGSFQVEVGGRRDAVAGSAPPHA